MNRKNRLKKGIGSIEKQKELHKIKMEQAQIDGDEELEGYYEKEIRALDERLRDRKDKLSKQ